MADMKRVVQAIDATTGDIKSVYKRLVDLGDGTYADTVAVEGTLTGSIEEHLWLSTDPEPVPVSNRALGVVIDVVTDEMTTKYWTGSAWQEVL